MQKNRFKGLGFFAFLMFGFGCAGIFVPELLPLVVAFSAVFLAGVVVVAADHIVSELRETNADAR